MSKRYTKESFSEAIDRRLSGFQADPWLARRVIGAREGEKPVKKLSAGAILAIVLLCVLITGAVAAAMQGLTINDFWKWLEEGGETKLPDNYEETIRDEVIQKDEIIAEDEHAVYTIPGYYCDGKAMTIVVNVAPKEDVLPVWYMDDEDMNEPIQERYYRTDVTEEVTLGEYAWKHHNGNVAEFCFWEAECGNVFSGGSEAVVLNGDGSISIIQDMTIDDPMPAERDVQMQISYKKGKVSRNDTGWHVDVQEEDTTMIPINLRTVKARKYVCKDGFDVPDVGVRVTEVRMEVNPLQIWCEMDFIVTDAELFGKQWVEREVTTYSQVGDRTYESQSMEKMDELDYEFVYPEGTEEEKAGKTVPEGPAGSYTGGCNYSEPFKGAMFHVKIPVSLDAFGSRFAIRARNMETGERFGTVEFTVEPAEE